MKHFYSVLCILFSLSLFGQTGNPMAKKIAEHHQKNATFETYQLFSRNPSPQKSALYRSAAKDAVVLSLNARELRKLLNEKPETVEISFPYKENEITVELFKQDIFTAGFQALNQNRESIDYEPGLYYRGIVKNDPQSVVAFSFFKNDVVGVASALGTGNVIVGKTKNTREYISYTDHMLTGMNPFRCATEKLPENQGRQISYKKDMGSSKTMTTSCVRIYYEIAYQPFVNNGQNTTTTLNWITAVHNNISTLYANDNIQIALSDVLVWTSPDPYTGSYSENLSLFSQSRLAFDGDLAHLVNSPATTSVAYLNSLCGPQRYAYSGISQFYEDIPVYSWTIQAMTHEMGHALGSPHTHACAWNGDNTAIDGCGPAAGYDEDCDAPLPSSGSIMSYCHLVAGVGINFANGFGLQPSALIRNTVDSKPCLGTDCIVSCTANVADVYFTNVSTTSATVTIVDNLSSSWKYRIYPYGNPTNTWVTTLTNSFNVSGFSPNTYYILEAGNICASGALGSNYQKLLLTNGDYCSGDKFMDPGKETENYGNNQSLVKTFYPNGNGTTTLTFTEFDLELDYDFMTLYDGENTSAPIFSNGENLSGDSIPGPFTSTNPTGAITVKFTSDVYVTGSGWEATIVCNLGIVGFESVPEVIVYPNPSSSLVNIESKISIQALKVYDMMGRLVIEKSQINSTHTRLQLGTLSSGTYFIRVDSGDRSQMLRIIKK